MSGDFSKSGLSGFRMFSFPASRYLKVVVWCKNLCVWSSLVFGPDLDRRPQYSVRFEPKVLYICVFGCCLMNHVIYLRLNQKLLLLKGEQTHKWQLFLLKMMIFFQTWPFWVKKLISLACNNNYFCLSSKMKST